MVFDATTQFAVFYSYSVNQGSTNLPPPQQTATMLLEQGERARHIDQRLWQHFWNYVIEGLPGLFEAVTISEVLQILFKPGTALFTYLRGG